MTYADLKNLKPTDINPHTFATMVKALQQREQQKKKKGCDLGLGLETNYYSPCSTRTYFYTALSWGVSEATACQIVPRIENALIKAKGFHLPGRKRLRAADH